VPRRIIQGRELSAVRTTTSAMLNYSVNHARSGSDSCSVSTAPLVASISPLHTTAILQSSWIFIQFRGLKAQVEPVAKLVPYTPPDYCSKLLIIRMLTGYIRRESHDLSHILGETARLSADGSRVVHFGVAGAHQP
jgi:hypothetical protein